MRSFKVDDVVAVETRIPLASLKLEKLLDAKVVAKSDSLQRCVAAIELGPFHGMNGLLLTVHRAFGEHRPLTLSPDDVWMAILQGFAIHVRENAESLRERFVEFSGRKTLTMATEDTSNWPANLRGFEKKLGEALGPGLLRALTSDFSTTSNDTHVAFCIAAMDTFSKYFDYALVGICGIPQVTLTGTVDDWKSVRDRFRVLAEYDLQWWSERLEPVLEQFISTASGEIDVDFWQSIYKPKKAYGGETITGWILRLFPYFESSGVFSRNPITSEGWVHEPVPPRALPRGLSAAQLRVNDAQVLSLHSGFFGAQQLADGSLAPLIGWTVSESEQERLFEELARRHVFEAALPNRSWTWGSASVPALLQAIGARFGGGSLYGGEVVWLPPPIIEPRGGMRCPQFVKFRKGEFVVIFGLHIASLRDGRRLVSVLEDRRDLVLLMDKEDDAQKPRVIANSLLELLQRFATDVQFPPWEVKGTWSPE